MRQLSSLNCLRSCFEERIDRLRAREHVALRVVHADPAQVLQLHSYYAILASVAAGSAVAVAPQAVLDLQRDPLPISTLPLAPCTTMFITRSGYRTPAVQQLLSILKSHRAPDAR